VSPPTADTIVTLHQSPKSAARKDSLGSAANTDLAAELIKRSHPPGIGMRGLIEAARARPAIGELRADLVRGNPSAPGVRFGMIAWIVVVFVVLPGRLRTFDQKPSVPKANNVCCEFAVNAANRGMKWSAPPYYSG
jgi:hypothetical protein